MQIFRTTDTLPADYNNGVVAIGNFDGVHIGHRQVIKTCKALAYENEAKSMVLTFDPHPASFFSKGQQYQSLTTLAQKLKLIESLGIDAVIIEDFTQKLASTGARDFLEFYLLEKYKVSHIVTGYNFYFGHKKTGNARILADFANNNNLKYTQIDQITYHGHHVSSSRIKELLAQGRVALASKLLGRNHRMEGTVVEGRKIASTLLSTPTANILLDDSLCLSLYGVYLVKIAQNPLRYGIANIGVKPTMDLSPPTLEVHIFEFNGNLYGKNIVVEFLEFIRPERKFKDVNALKKQISDDIQAALYALKNITQDECL